MKTCKTYTEIVQGEKIQAMVRAILGAGGLTLDEFTRLFAKNLRGMQVLGAIQTGRVARLTAEEASHLENLKKSMSCE